MSGHGGAAFPSVIEAVSNVADSPDYKVFSEGGMTLLDWFAGQALAGICANSIPGSHHIPEQTVRDAYSLADLMLSERELRGGK